MKYFAIALLAAVLLTSSGCATKPVQSDPATAPVVAVDPAQEQLKAAAELAAANKGVEEESVPDRPAVPAPPETSAATPTLAPLPYPPPEAKLPELKTIYFDYNQYLLSPETTENLAGNAAFIKAKPGMRVLVQGHCDARGSDQYNIALGERRAEAAKDYLVSLGVAADRLETVSYGEERPVDPEENEAAWAKNRRVEFAPLP